MPDDRLEQEINEILDKIEQFPDPESRRARNRKRLLRRLAGAVADQQRALVRKISRISISQVMIASFVLILGSFLLGRFLGPARTWMLLAGVILFVSAFAATVFSTKSGPSGSTYWRGQEINYGATTPPWVRLRRWFANRRSRR
ncbi:MAG TPA: hypothetical protein QF624_04740 [Dehalococcoidia bacterium]|nr:hypothetical protein [Dehalococcoidia bacterium]